MEHEPINREELIAITGEIVAAHVSNNAVGINDVGQLIANVHGALSGVLGPVIDPEAPAVPMVPVRSSVKPGSITCLVCGAKMLTMRRHLRVHHDMTDAAYRAKYGLPKTYPMVAPDYTARRRALAISLGLGTANRAKRSATLSLRKAGAKG